MGAGRRAIWRLSRLELARPIAHASTTRHGPLPPVLRSRHLLQLPTADQPAEPSARMRHAHGERWTGARAWSCRGNGSRRADSQARPSGARPSPVRASVTRPGNASAMRGVKLGAHLACDFSPRLHRVCKRPVDRNTPHYVVSVSSTSQYKVAEPSSSTGTRKVARG